MQTSDEKPKPVCADKLIFSTKAEAEGAKIYAEHLHGTKLKVYKCKHCAGWHLASKY